MNARPDRRGVRVAVMPGDGVGPEVIDATLPVLSAAAAAEGVELEWTHYPHAVGYTEPSGARISDETIDDIACRDGLLFGAQGGAADGSDGVATRPLAAITNRLDLSVGVRGARLYAGRLSPLRDPGPAVDVLLVRDSSEDCYAVPGGTAHAGHPHELSLGLLVYTRTAVDRVLTYGLRAASRRRGRLELVTQIEGVSAHRLWHERLEVLAAAHPDVEVGAMLPDTAASRLVETPGSLDVVVTTYWIGGILSNLMASVVGGVGLLPSARVNPDRPFGLFEPAHGTAQRHVGRGTVSPVAAVRAGAMLLDFVGEAAAATRIEDAVASALATGRLPDVTTRSGVSTADAGRILADLVGGDR